MKITIEMDAYEAVNAIESGTLKPLLRIAMDEVESDRAPEPKEAGTRPEVVVPVTEPKKEPIPQAPTAVPTQEVPTAAPAFTRDQLALAATQLMDQGKMPELQKILTGMGVKALTELSEERFGAFAAAIRELGAKI